MLRYTWETRTESSDSNVKQKWDWKKTDNKIVFLKSDNFIFHYERQFVWISGNWHSSDVKTNSGKFMVLKIWSLSWLLIFFIVVKVKRNKISLKFTSKYWFLVFQFYFYWCQSLHTNSDLFPYFFYSLNRKLNRKKIVKKYHIHRQDWGK